MKNISHYLLLSCIYFITSYACKAQYPLYLLEIGAGANAVRGDLAESYEKWGASFHLGLRLNPEKGRLSAKLSFDRGQLVSHNLDLLFKEEIALDNLPAFYVETEFTSFHIDLMLNIINREYFKFYFSQGIGFMNFIPRDQEGQDLTFQLETRAPDENFENRTFLMPSSFGAIYFFKNGFAVGSEVGLIHPFSDYIDNLGQLSPDKVTPFGTIKKADNALIWKFSFFVPLKFRNRAIRYER